MRISKVILLSHLFFCILINNSRAQEGFGNNRALSCAADRLMKELLLKDSSIYNINKQIEKTLLHYKRYGQRALNPSSIITLPVVVHIIHNNGPENISDALVLAGIQHMNEAYANTGYYDPASGVNTNIQFCLAQRDPNNLATTGITRNISTYTNMGGMNYNSDDITVKNINRWNPNCYINIWLVNNIPGPVAGYACLPAAHGTNMDGILMEAAYWGSSYSNDVVIIHEMGHYLGLYHTFEQGCTNNDCTTDGDKVCDTPPDNSTTVTSCNLTVNSCATDVLSGFATDQNDLTRDYLDYGNWDCMSVFTQGQADRMNWHILNVRSSLMHCNSCLSPCPAPVTANFTSSTHTAPAGTNISFTNTSANGVSYSWYVNDVMVSSAFNYSQMFTKQGTNIIKLVVESSDPAFCLPQEKVDSVKITCSTHASFTPGYNGVAAVGQNINFINTSTNATSYEWYYNNNLVATSPNYNVAFNTSGIHYIKLKAGALYCNDSLSLYYLINAPASPNFSFQKRYSSSLTHTFQSNFGLITPDQNILQVGDLPYSKNIISRLSGTGNMIWSKSYINNTNPYYTNISFKKAIFTNDGNLVYIGLANNPVIMKTDINGNIVWNRYFHEPAHVDPTDILELPDGSYIVSGDYYYGYLIFL